MAEQKAQVRKHYFLDEYVVIAPKRTHALHHKDFAKQGILREPPLADEKSVYEIKKPNGDWAVKVIRNIYPAFSSDNAAAYGVQEVVLETNPHDTPFAQLAVGQIQNLLHAWCQRVSELKHDPKISYVSIFHNDGLEAGASVKQTHSQIIAMEVVPPALKTYAETFAKLKKQYGASPIERAMRWEEQQKKRVIYTDKQLDVVAPYASQFPYEVWLVPKRAAQSICDLNAQEVDSLARAFKAVAAALESEQMSYNFMLIENLKNHDNHFYVRICPRPNVWAGFELSTGIPINPAPPEDVADWYKNFIDTHNAL